MQFTVLLLLAVVLVGISIMSIAIKMFFSKGDFKKQCSSVDPTTGRRIGCNCENKEESCHNK
ncbi:MAG: hypothetical protein KBG80_03035 [Breznakibacter sp.]|nr:hypothetical protein [Breznakibacter sp.]